MKYVLDSNVAFKWLVPEKDTDKALLLRDDYNNGIHELLAPDILPIEVAHALTRAERQKRITPAQSAVLLKDMMRNVPKVHAYLPLLTRAYDISSLYRIGVYDCVYVALAEREKCTVVTGDDKLIKNLQTDFPFIVALATLP